MAKLLKRVRAAVCLVFAGFAFWGPIATAQKASAVCNDDCVVKAIRERVVTLQDAFNRGDQAVVLSIYHPSMVQVAGSRYIDYATHMKDLRAYLATSDRPQLKLELNSVRPLDADYAVANGRYHMVSKDGKDETALFSTIYMRTDAGWKIIYTHSS